MFIVQVGSYCYLGSVARLCSAQCRIEKRHHAQEKEACFMSFLGACLAGQGRGGVQSPGWKGLHLLRKPSPH